MQCYESQFIRLGLHQSLSRIAIDIDYDDMVLSDVLHEHGIDSFEQLARLNSDQLQQMAERLGLRLALAA